MEKELEKSGIMLETDQNKGTVQVSEDVIAMIASLAATEVEGVSSMSGNITNELMSKVGVKNLTKGVKVEYFDKELKVSLTVVMEYGYIIPTTCQQVQSKVKSMVENMTGITCSEVNVRISGINVRK